MKQKKRTKVIGNTTAKNRNIRDESMLRRRNSTKSTKRKIKLTPDQQVYMGSIDAKGLEIQYLADYTYALLKNYRRPVAYDYIGQVDDEYDYNKFKYEKKKKTKEAQKKQREAIVDIKEFRLSVTIDKHDFDTRVNNAKKALLKGDKVKGSIRFKGRQIAHPELARDVLKRFEEALSEVADVEIQPKLEGRSMFMQLTPKK